MDDVIFRFIEEKSFEDAVLIVGLPGIGSVALLAADQLISELGQKKSQTYTQCICLRGSLWMITVLSN